jgi:hypothetical protein
LAQAATPNFDCARFLELARRGSLGFISDPVAVLKKEMGPQIYDPQLSGGLYQLEDDVYQLFQTAPALRDITAFSQKWNFSEDQVLDVLTFYGLSVFYGDIRIAGSPDVVIERIKQIALELYLDDHPDFASRKVFYEANLTLLSIPQIAKAVGISEKRVYNELRSLRLTVLGAFNQSPNFENAKERFAKGESIEKVATELGFGVEALTYILHHTRLHNKEMSWDRILIFRGVPKMEREILAQLESEGLRGSGIAAVLNELSGASPSSPNFRTEAAVWHKLNELGTDRATDDLFLSDYGYVKKNGSLLRAGALRFIFENYAKSDEEIAETLGVTMDALRKFYARNFISRIADRFKVENDDDAETKLLNLYEEQIQTVDKVLDWYVKNKTIARSDFVKIGVPENRFFGNKGEKSLFPTAIDAWFAIKRRAQQRGIKFELLDIRIQFNNDAEEERARQEWQIEASDRIIDWSAKNEFKTPVPGLDFAFEEGKIQLDPSRLVGNDEYRSGRKRSSRIFDDADDAWTFVKKRAIARGLPFNLHPLRFLGRIPPKILEIQKQEILQIIANFMWEKRRHPYSRDFRSGEIPVHYDKFYGLGDYNEDGKKAPLGFYPNQRAAKMAVQQFVRDDERWKGLEVDRDTILERFLTEKK